MAKQYRVEINIPMAEALKRMLIRNECTLCGKTMEEHSWVQLTEKGQLVDCSNREE